MCEQFRSIEKLINDIAAPHATANGTGHERAKAELDAKLANDICSSLEKLNESITESSISNDQLGRKISWLNIILALATTVGAIATVAIAVKT